MKFGVVYLVFHLFIANDQAKTVSSNFNFFAFRIEIFIYRNCFKISTEIYSNYEHQCFISESIEAARAIWYW